MVAVIVVDADETVEVVEVQTGTVSARVEDEVPDNELQSDEIERTFGPDWTW